MPEREIQLGPVSRPEGPDGPDHDPVGLAGGPDLLSVGPDPDRPARGSWLPEQWRRRLPERWWRPVPRWLVGVSSAAAAAVAVAAYLGGPVASATDPPPTAPLLVPESWLDVTEVENPDGIGPGPAGGELLGPDGRPDPRIAPAIARHPAAAIVVQPLRLFQPRLVGLPPGAYQLRASCELAERRETLPDPLPVAVSLGSPEQIPYADGEGICDGQLWTVGEPAVIDGYQAVHVDYQPAFALLPTDDIDPHFELSEAGVLVVISITPVG